MFKFYKKIDLACNITAASLVVEGTITGGTCITLNPVILDVISGSGVLLKTFSENKNFKSKIEMCKFAYTSYEKILTDI